MSIAPHLTPQERVNQARDLLRAALQLLNQATQPDDWYDQVRRGEMADGAAENVEQALSDLEPYTAEEVAEIDEEARRFDEQALRRRKVVPLFSDATAR